MVAGLLSWAHAMHAEAIDKVRLRVEKGKGRHDVTTNELTPNEAMVRIKGMTECSPAKGCAVITEARRKEMQAQGVWLDHYEIGQLDPYRNTDTRTGDAGGCGHGSAGSALRQVLCLLPDSLDEAMPWGYRAEDLFSADEIPWADELKRLVKVIADAAFGDAPWTRELITELALDDSLCPIHFCDYASCFDDDEEECAAVRLIHPSHDT